MSDKVSIGRLYLRRSHRELRIVDIALLPEFRGRGIGSRLLTAVLREAQSDDIPVRIHVENFNPAMKLYKRLGFRRESEDGVYHLMHWVPSTGATPTSDPVQTLPRLGIEHDQPSHD